MRIVLAVPYYVPHVGGLQRHAHVIASGLVRRGHQVRVLTSQHDLDVPRAEVIEGVAVLRMPIDVTVSNTPVGFSWPAEIKRVLRETRPDVVLAHSPVPGISDVAFALRGAVPFVLKYHAGSMLKGSMLLDPAILAYERLVLRRMVLRADAVLSVHPSFLRDLVQDRRKIIFSPPGVDTLVFSPPETPVEKVNDVLFVGRLDKSSPWKGVGTLLRALAIMRHEGTSVTARFVGGGDGLAGYREEAAGLGLEAVVSFPGVAVRERLVEHYRQSRVLVLPSETDAEGFGNVLIEAMACGTPVIGSNVGGIPNVIKHGRNGLLVPPRDSGCLARAISDLLSDAAGASALGLEGLSYVRREFTVEQLVSTTESALLGAAHGLG